MGDAIAKSQFAHFPCESVPPRFGRTVDAADLDVADPDQRFEVKSRDEAGSDETNTQRGHSDLLLDSAPLPGIAESSARVYSCDGRANRSAVGPISTIFPRCITATRSQICAAT